MLNYKKSFSNLKSSMDKPISDFSSDSKLSESLVFIENQITLADANIAAGKLHQAHLDLEEVRKEWLVAFERNNVGILAVYMTQFHDIMELAAEYDYENIDYIELSKICNDLNESWSVVEDLKVGFSGSDLEDYNRKVQVERENIDVFCSAVSNKENNLEDLSSKLKKDFIIVYL